jgi:hypothetical protein
LLDTVNKELQLIIENVMHVLCTPEFELLMLLPRLKLVVEEAEVGHNFKVRRL